MSERVFVLIRNSLNIDLLALIWIVISVCLIREYSCFKGGFLFNIDLSALIRINEINNDTTLFTNNMTSHQAPL